MLFVCPKCKEKLNISGGALKCQNGHSYDRSRKGYYNLLLSNKSGTHGDNRLMVDSRRAFLDKGFYAPLAEKLSELAVKVTPPRGCVLDIGCGEGYYTEFIQRAIEKRDGSAQIYAFDISKDATALAARRVPSVGFAVASAYDMPIADGTVDTAVNMFSPLATGEIYRSLNANGHFIMAIPGVEHLFGLKSKLYSEPYKNTVNDPEIEGFELVTSESITYEIKLESNEDIRNLFGMTPYAYRTGKEGRELIEKLEKLETTVDFIIFAYKKVQ